jgi:hypothetical protein
MQLSGAAPLMPTKPMPELSASTMGEPDMPPRISTISF